MAKTESAEGSEREGGAAITETIVRYGIYATIILVPLVFSRSFHMAFTMPKATFFRIATAALAAVFLIGILLRRRAVLPRDIWKHPFLVTTFIYFAALFATSAFSPNTETAFFGTVVRQTGLLTFIHYALFFWLIVLVFKKKDEWNALLKTVAFSGTLVALYGVLQKLGIDPLFASWPTEEFLGRVFSTAGQPNFLGQVFVLTIGASAGAVFSEKRNWLRALFVVAALIQVGALFFTQSRAALLGFVVAVVFFMIACGAIAKKKKFIAAGVLVVALGAAGLFGVQTLRSGEFSYGQSIRARLALVPTALNVWLEDPLLGHGLDTFRYTSTRYQTPELLRSEHFIGIADRAHNEFLDYAVWSGLLGVAAYALLLYALFSASLKRTALSPLAILAALFGHLIAKQFGFGVIDDTMLFWALAAYVVGTNITATPRAIVSFKGAIAPIALVFAIAALMLNIVFFQIKPARANMLYQKAVSAEIFSEKEALLSRAAALAPFESAYAGELAELYLKQSRNAQNDEEKETLLAAAERHARRAIFLSSERNAIAWTVLGDIETEWTLLDPDRETLARAAHNAATRHAPLHPLVVRSAADAFLSFGDGIAAREILLPLLEASPPYYRWKNDLANRSPKEQEKFRIFYKDNPDFDTLIQMLGRAYALEGNFEASRQWQRYYLK